MTLSYDFAHSINETSKCLTQLPALMQSHSGGDSVASRYKIQKFLTPPPPNCQVPNKP